MILNARGVDTFSVDKRIDVKITSFQFGLLSKYNPREVMDGTKVQFLLKNLYGSFGGGILFNGRIEKIDDTIDYNKRSFSVSGRNVAMFLEEQPFYSPCYKVSTGVKRSRTLLWLLNRIKTGTGCQIGPEVTLLNDQVFTNDPSDNNHYCGMFKKRSDAIDWLFQRYGELNNKPAGWFHWWIDTAGYIRLLDTTRTQDLPTMKIVEFPSAGIIKIKIGVNVQTIENDVTVIGGENNDIRVRKYDKDNIKKYGRRPADPIQDNSLTTTSQVEARANEELEKRKKPVLVGEIVTVGFPTTECGLGVEFYFSERYKDIKFIITSIKHGGKGGNYTTTLGVSTDKNVLINPNLSDIVEQIIKARTPVISPTQATVTSVNTQTGSVYVTPVSVMDSGVKLQNNGALAGRGSLQVKVL